MELVLLSDFETVTDIYDTYLTQDFPRTERRPLEMIEKPWRQGNYECFGMYEGEELLGYAFLMKIPAEEGEGFAYLLDYMAVISRFRDRGYGTDILKLLADRLTDAQAILVEVEDPEKAEDEKNRQIRERRIQFYLRNGYSETNAKVSLFGVHYNLMTKCRGRMLSDEQVRKAYAALYKKMVPEEMFRAFFELNWEQ